MSNGVGVLANALQSYLARKHAAGMLEAQQANQAQRDAVDQEWKGRDWQREAGRHEQDWAQKLDQQAWERNWKQQSMDNQMELKQANLEAMAAREQARQALEREKMEATKALWESRNTTQRDIAKGNQEVRKQTAPRPGAGRGGARSGSSYNPADAARRQWDTTVRMKQSELNKIEDVLSRLNPANEDELRPGLEQRRTTLRQELTTLYTQRPPDAATPPTGAQQAPPPSAAPDPEY